MSGIVSDTGSNSRVVRQQETVDHWMLTSNQAGNATPLSGFTRHSSYQANMGPAMTEASGVFTFPFVGLWQIDWTQNYSHSASSRYIEGVIQDNSSGSFQTKRYMYGNFNVASSTWYVTAYATYIFRCNTLAHQIRFTQSAESSVTTKSGLAESWVSFRNLNPQGYNVSM